MVPLATHWADKEAEEDPSPELSSRVSPIFTPPPDHHVASLVGQDFLFSATVEPLKSRAPISTTFHRVQFLVSKAEHWPRPPSPSHPLELKITLFIILELWPQRKEGK